MNIDEITEIIQNISYKLHWYILISYDTDKESQDVVTVQLRNTNAIDSVTGENTSWKSGKRHVSKFMCRQEIVGMVYGMIEAAEIHEMRELFRYKGRSIYNPHIDPDALVEIASKAENFNCRDDSMQMREDHKISDKEAARLEAKYGPIYCPDYL